MIIGITKEIKTDENRVAITPAGVENQGLIICNHVLDSDCIVSEF